ncbi:hypothetical protein Tco_0823197 [Tanacetum coccineum]|uniref:Uncharacterized protein n=1 Tax=Tanacetum coccineum TaxID=301880 RepID=A0ABQ5ALJ7_9ASTR
MNSSMCITLIGRDSIYSGNPFSFIGKGIKVYKLTYSLFQGDCFIAFDIKQSFPRLVNLLEVKQHVSTSVKEIDNVQLGIVNQAELKLLPKAFLSFSTVAETETEGLRNSTPQEAISENVNVQDDVKKAEDKSILKTIL